jgi:hypothetical protein
MTSTKTVHVSEIRGKALHEGEKKGSETTEEMRWETLVCYLWPLLARWP